MSREFAEHIIDSMVDENGHCGERGLSEKQFDILSEYLEEGEEHDAGYWEGDYKTIWFSSCDYEGNIGKYHVVLNLYRHFNLRFTVKEIALRSAEEIEAEQTKKRMVEELHDFTDSEWMYEVGQRVELSLTLVNDHEYSVMTYHYYDNGERHIYTFRDESGNCYVWKTSKRMGQWAKDERGCQYWKDVESGEVFRMRATVKEHGEYKGTKQTVLTRVNVNYD